MELIDDSTYKLKSKDTAEENEDDLEEMGNEEVMFLISAGKPIICLVLTKYKYIP